MRRTVFRRQDAVLRLGERHVRREVKAGRWRSIGGVIIAHNAVPTWHERLAAGVLSKPPGRAAADGLSALFLAGVVEQPPTPEIVLSPGVGRPALPGITFGWTLDLQTKTVDGEWLARLTAAHALLRALADIRAEREARALVARCLQRKAVTPDCLREALGPAPRYRHAALVREVAADFEGGIESLPEREYALINRRNGFPEPTRQRRVQGRDGRYYLDNDYDGYGFSVEVHGWHHFEFRQREADLDRKNDIVSHGRRMLEFSSWAIRRQPDRVAAVLRATLRSAGWSPR